MAMAPNAIAEAMQRALPRRWAAGSMLRATVAGPTVRSSGTSYDYLLALLKSCARWYAPARKSEAHGGSRKRSVQRRRCRHWQYSAFAVHMTRGGNPNAHRNREVVQRREGLRLHHAGGRRQGPVRPPH